jgi:hypothetical protein
MLICVNSYKLELRSPLPTAKAAKSTNPTETDAILSVDGMESVTGALIKNLEVVLVIDELRVISFDRYGMKMPSSVAFDDLVRTNLSYLRHFLMKQSIYPQEFEMAP